MRASAQEAISTNLVLVRSSDAPPGVSKAQVVHCTRQLVHAMNVDGTDLPHILVLNVSKDVAHAAGVRKMSVRRNTGSDGAPYFELWIVGDTTLSDYIATMGTILERHFGLNYTKEQRKQVLHRAVRYLAATVEAPGE